MKKTDNKNTNPQDRVRYILEDIIYTKKLIEELHRQREYLRNRAAVFGASFGDIPKPSNKNPSSSVEAAILQIEDCEKTIIKQVKKLTKKYKLALHLLEQIADSKVRLILIKRFIDNKSAEQIAEEMSYSVRHIQRMVLSGIEIMADELVRMEKISAD